MTRHSNNFDLIRLLAALQVVIGHAVDHFQPHLPAAVEPVYTVIRWFPGVPVFFALSGYLLAKSLDRNDDLVNYSRNRALRILPALWAVTAATLLLLAVAGLLQRLEPVRLVAFTVAQMTVGQSWAPFPVSEYGLGAPLTPNPALWTIRVEIGFYLILPVLLLGGRVLLRSARRIDILLAAVAVASYATYAVWVNPAGEGGYPALLRLLVNSPAPYLWLFIAGVLLHRHDEVAKRVLAGRAWLWTAVFLAARLAVHLGFETGDGELTQAAIAATGLANLILVAPAFAVAFSAAPAVRALHPAEDISYGVYVWHMVLINAIVHWDLLGGWAAVAATMAGAVAAGHLSWKLVESPALSRKRRPAIRPGLFPMPSTPTGQPPPVVGTVDPTPRPSLGS